MQSYKKCITEEVVGAKKMYETVILHVLQYGAELWRLRNKEERVLAATEMKMLLHIKGITLLDRLRNKDIRIELKVDWRSNRFQSGGMDNYLEWMKKTKENKFGRPRGRPRKRWMENLTKYMMQKGIKDDHVQDRNLCRQKIQILRPGNNARHGGRMWWLQLPSTVAYVCLLASENA